MTRNAIAEALACVDAAYAGGWIDALANGDIERIRDLWYRRLSFAVVALREPDNTHMLTKERNPHAVWLRQFAEFIRDAISPTEKQRLQHCADLIDRGAGEKKEQVYGPVIYGTMTARNPNDVTQVLWVETGSWVAEEDFNRLRESHGKYEAWAESCEPAPDSIRAAFKNFHRLLCERFGYVHDSEDWERDQLSLIEHIAQRSQVEPTRERQEDRAYYSGARQAAAMAHQSLQAMDEWINAGCGGRGPVVNR